MGWNWWQRVYISEFHPHIPKPWFRTMVCFVLCFSRVWQNHSFLILPETYVMGVSQIDADGRVRQVKKKCSSVERKFKLWVQTFLTTNSCIFIVWRTWIFEAGGTNEYTGDTGEGKLVCLSLRHWVRTLVGSLVRDWTPFIRISGTWYLVCGTWYLISGTCYLVPDTWYKGPCCQQMVSFKNMTKCSHHAKILRWDDSVRRCPHSSGGSSFTAFQSILAQVEGHFWFAHFMIAWWN